MSHEEWVRQMKARRTALKELKRAVRRAEKTLKLYGK
jgi:hypothetical protein